MMAMRLGLLMGVASLVSGAALTHAEGLNVVVTSKPIHSLVAAVMEGVGTPRLIVDGMNSPHTFALKPSGAAAINAADLMFRVSGGIEPWTEKVEAALPTSVTLVTLADTPGLALYDVRAGATFEEHDDGDHDGDHDHDAKDGHGHDDHDHEGKDGHVWLDPANAKLMAGAIAARLSAKDPAHATVYAANAARLAADIDKLTTAIAAEVKPIANRPFVVFHDATQYFERRFGLHAVGSITVSPQVQPSAQRLSAVRAKIATLGAACVFSEPLFQPKLLAAVTEGSSARSQSLDPEGLLLEPGPRLYTTLMTTLAGAITGCLAGL